MKRKYFIALTLFSVLSLLTVTLFQLYAELTLSQAATLLVNKIAVLNGYNTALTRALSTMDDEKRDWDANEEDIVENRIDYATADLFGLAGAVLKQVIDMKHRASIAVSLGSAIAAVQTAKSDPILRTTSETPLGRITSHLRTRRAYPLENGSQRAEMRFLSPILMSR